MSNKFIIKNGAVIENAETGAVVFDVQGMSGQVFSITDDLTNNILNITNIIGIPILVVDADGKVTTNSSGAGSTVFNVQGIEDQLFSVTDDLSDKILTVSDILGIPIINVNADRSVEIDGSLSISGVLNANASSATYASTVTLTADNSTNATNYPLFVNAATGNLSPRTDTDFTYNPSTGLLSANSLSINTGGYFGNQLEIEIPGGTSPFLVNSSTVNTNLNADLLDGKHIGSSGVSYIPYVDSLAKFKLANNDAAYPSEISFSGYWNDATSSAGNIIWSKIVSRDSQGVSLAEIVCDRHTNLSNVKGSLAFYTGGRIGSGRGGNSPALYLKPDNSAQLNNTAINGTLEVTGSLTCTNGSIRNGITNSSTYGSVTTQLLNGGYTKLPSGIIMQYGRYGVGSVTGEGRFRFPIDFPTDVVSVNITLDNNDYGISYPVSIVSFATTHVSVDLTSNLTYKYFHITAFGY